MKTWVIINESNYKDLKDNGFLLSTRRRPSYIHTNKQLAIKELVSLKKRFPYFRFVLYESIMECRKDDDCLYEIKE